MGGLTWVCAPLSSEVAEVKSARPGFCKRRQDEGVGRLWRFLFPRPSLKGRELRAAATTYTTTTDTSGRGGNTWWGWEWEGGSLRHTRAAGLLVGGQVKISQETTLTATAIPRTSWVFEEQTAGRPPVHRHKNKTGSRVRTRLRSLAPLEITSL